MKTKLNLNSDGSFRVTGVNNLNYLYFPLTNHYGMKSAITPKMSGDAKVDQDGFILLPTSIEDLHSSLAQRNVYFRVNDSYTWSITGNTAYQTLQPDQVTLDARFLCHTITRKSNDFECVIESFVPYDNYYQELHKITFKNTTDKPIDIKPVVSVPIHSRSADNLRDHRHVTALFNRFEVGKNSLINTPTFSFDERGHNLNKRQYGVSVSANFKVKHFWPILEEFVGEGGSLLDPLTVRENRLNDYKIGDVVTGYEMTGAFEHHEVTLLPQESLSFVVSIFMNETPQSDERQTNVDEALFDTLKDTTIQKWDDELSSLKITFGNKELDGWIKWTTLQPILRRIYGCSFLPHHDYGRGGKGWRDLWQDCLALILMNPTEVRTVLYNNFSGVRIDGSNATIIGEKPGEFLADRNSISRVWMDHGSWPFLTTKLYIDKSGDYNFLLTEQKYFHDKFTHYTKKVRKDFSSTSNILSTTEDTVYSGTILEHLMIQNLVPYYNVGEHNNLRLEDADWNDGLDMAGDRGESVAFTSLYGSNLIELSNMLFNLHNFGINTIDVLEEFNILLQDVDAQDVDAKQRQLHLYFDTISKGITGKKVALDVVEVARNLKQKGEHLLQQVRENEWLEGTHGSWFNGYYDDDANQLDDANKGHMTLTGQVFAIYSGSATEEQTKSIIDSADKHLYDPSVGGYRLNTNFNEIKTNMGRLFGFAYGHKENGAMFSHMAVMYAHALYKRGFAHAGNKVIETIFKHSMNINQSKIYPGIPEYFDPKGRGMYNYLTGSASWVILTEVTEVFGIKGNFGAIILEPKLLKYQFNKDGIASIKTLIMNQLIEFIYVNPDGLDYGEYTIDTVISNNETLKTRPTKYGVEITSNIASDTVYIHLKKKTKEV